MLGNGLHPQVAITNKFESQHQAGENGEQKKAVNVPYYLNKIVHNLHMGFTSSKEQLALNEAKRIRENLYERVGQAKRSYADSFAAISPQTKRTIRESPASKLSDMLDSQETTSVQILLVFMERAATIAVQNNYVLDQMFDEAMEEAKICDEIRKSDKYQKKSWRPGRDRKDCYPPLFGVPVSVKENILLKGRQTHVGFVSKVNPIRDVDGHFVMMVRKMGLIPFVRTNVPQGCKAIETNNNMFGYCKNPWNTNHSCGGSSGGESGIISSFCSPIGFGTDIGGSLRVPAAFTGLYTIKPWNRYSRMGNCFYGKMSGGVNVKAELGSMTRSMEDLILTQQFLCNPENYEDVAPEMQDPTINYKPLNLEIVRGKKKMKIGVAKRLKTSRCAKPIERAIDETVEILRGLGHEIQMIGNLGRFEELYFFMVVLFTFDQNLLIFEDLRQGEPLTKEYKLIKLMSKIPWIIRKIIIWLIRKRQPRLAKMIQLSGPVSNVGILYHNYEVEKVIASEVYSIFAENRLDAILMPCFATPAPVLGEANKLQYFLSYCASWNVMHYPAGSLPITVCKPGEIQFQDEFNDFYTNAIRSTMKSAAGLPVGVQIVSTPYNEEKILSLMSQISEEVRFNEKYHIPE